MILCFANSQNNMSSKKEVFKSLLFLTCHNQKKEGSFFYQSTVHRDSYPSRKIDTAGHLLHRHLLPVLQRIFPLSAMGYILL